MDLLQIGTDMGYNFISNTAYNTYMEQIRALRESLIGNAIDYSTSNASITDEATKKFYNKVHIYSLAMQTLTIGTEAIIETLNKNKYNNQLIKTEALIIDAEKVHDNETRQTQNYYDKDIVNRRKELTRLKYKNFRNIGYLQDYPYKSYQQKSPPSEEDINNENDVKKYWESIHGPDEVSKELKASGFESNSNTFPQLGKPLKTHDPQNGTNFIDRGSFEILNKGNKEIIFKGWSKFGMPDPDKYSTPSNPMSEKISRMIEEYRRITPGSYKFFIEKLHGRDAMGKFFTKGAIKKGASRVDMPNRMLFPAYIMAFNDSYNSSWSDYSFIGRGEKVWIFQQTTRELTVEFYMISDFSADILLQAIEEARLANNSIVKAIGGKKIDLKKPNLNTTSFTTTKDSLINSIQSGANFLKDLDPENALKELKRLLPDWGLGSYPLPSIIDGNYAGFVGGQLSGTPEMLWARLTFLAQCVYPWYRKDGKLKEQPFVRIRIGDFIDCVAKINSIALNEYDQFDMDLNPSFVGAIPMGVRVALNMTIVHEDEPTSNYTRFYWRADFDKEAADYVPSNISQTSNSLDTTLDNHNVGSAIYQINPYSDVDRNNQTIPKEEIANQEELSKFNKALQGLGNKTKTFAKEHKQQIKAALIAAVRFLIIKKENDALKLQNINTEQIMSGSDMIMNNSDKIKSIIGKPNQEPSEPQTNLKKKLFSFSKNKGNVE